MAASCLVFAGSNLLHRAIYSTFAGIIDGDQTVRLQSKSTLSNILLDARNRNGPEYANRDIYSHIGDRDCMARNRNSSPRNDNQKAFDLEERPYFAFSDFALCPFVKREQPRHALRESHFRVGLVFRNPGKVPVRYGVTEIRVTFDAQTMDNPALRTQAE
jgi:hypothetical protein